MEYNFTRSMEFVFDVERGFQNDPRDRGNHLPDGRLGSTNLGVTQAAWERYLKRKVTEQDMRALTRALVTPFYKSTYWDFYGCNSLPVGIDYLLFDFAVNANGNRGVRMLQNVVNTSADGIIGRYTLTAVNLMPPKALVSSFTEAKRSYYKSLKDPTYEKGWLNRCTIVQEHALSMIRNPGIK